MMRFVRDVRLIPITVIAVACLLVLKAADFLLSDDAPPTTEGAALHETPVIHAAPGVLSPGEARLSWAQEMFNFPSSKGAAPAKSNLPQLAPITPLADKNADIITGSVAGDNEGKTDAKPNGEGAEAPAKEGKEGKPGNAGKEGPPGPGGKGELGPAPAGKVIVPDVRPLPSAAERALLERLAERRQELDKRARELDIREGLIAEAEKRMDTKLNEIKNGEAQLEVAAEKKEETEAAHLKSIVTMYENMKPRDAAKIFDRLEINVLIDVASQINPRRMADILAQMSPDAAEKLTVELANRAKSGTKPGADLPKIEGKPITP